MRKFMDEEYAVANEEILGVVAHRGEKAKRAAKYAYRDEEVRLNYSRPKSNNSMKALRAEIKASSKF